MLKQLNKRPKVSCFIVYVRRYMSLLACLGLLTMCCSCVQCGSDRMVRIEDSSLSAELYADGRLVASGVISCGSPAAQAMQKVLRDRDGRWRTSNVSYASVVLVRGPHVRLNFQKGRLVANVTEASGNPIQLEAELSYSEYQEIRKLISEAMAL